MTVKVATPLTLSSSEILLRSPSFTDLYLLFLSRGLVRYSTSAILLALSALASFSFLFLLLTVS